MGDIIERDPAMILDYVRKADREIDEVESRINALADLLKRLEPDMHDKNCLVKFRELALSADYLKKCLEKLRDEDGTISREAKKLMDIIEGGMGGRGL